MWPYEWGYNDKGRDMVHGARHILMLMTLYRYIISVYQIRQKCWKINYICNTHPFGNVHVHPSSQILTRSVKRGQLCAKNKMHVYEFYHKKNVTEKHTTLECLLAQKNNHIRRYIQRLGK